MISVIVYGRNDAHGYNMHKRVSLSLNCIAEVLTHPEDEIIFVDCNTPDELPTFPESIHDILTARARRLLRIFRLRPALYEKHKRDSQLKVLEPLARNVGIRRANPANRWILSTNTDMVFVVRQEEKSLSDVVGEIPDGFYELPRFEMPEALWETVDRLRPRGVIRAFAHWGRRFHLNEVVHGQPYNLFDGPGDFQLFLRDQIFRIHGFHEEMVAGWHVDSNLAKRLNLLNGETRSLLEQVFAYHCDHTRQPTMMHGEKRKTGNNPVRFVDRVSSPELPEQAESWGLPDEAIEEISIEDGYNRDFVTVLEAILPGMEEPYLEDALLPQAYNAGLLYDNRHALPYLADHFVTQPADLKVGYVGANEQMVRLLAEFLRRSKRTGEIFVDREMLPDAGSEKGKAWPASCFVVDLQELLQRADVIVFDLSMAHLPQTRNSVGWRVPARTAEVLNFAARLYRRFIEIARAEKARSADGSLPPKKFLILGSQNTYFEPVTLEMLGIVLAAYSTRVRHGTLRYSALDKRLDVPPLFSLMIENFPEALNARFAGEVRRPVTDAHREAAQRRVLAFIAGVATADASDLAMLQRSVLQALRDLDLSEIDVALLRVQHLMARIDGRKLDAEFLENLLNLLEKEDEDPDLLGLQDTLRRYKARLQLPEPCGPDRATSNPPAALSRSRKPEAGPCHSVRWVSPLLDRSGYARHARAAVLSLVKAGVEVQAVPLYVDPTFVAKLDSGQRRLLEASLAQEVDAGTLVFFHQPGWPISGEFADFYELARRRNPGFDVYVGATSFECAGIPASWVAACNRMDEIWVPTSFNRKTFSEAGVDPEKLHVFGFGLDQTLYDPRTVKPMLIEKQRGFTFLSTFEWSPRKGWDLLLKAYLEAFSVRDDVCLILKTGAGRRGVRKAINRFIEKLGYRCDAVPPVIVLDEILAETYMPSLYAAADAFVLPSRGEGFGIPYLEAMSMGLPVIGTRWSGHLDFMNDRNSFLIEVDGLVPVGPAMVRVHPQFEGQTWAQPSLRHLCELMREVYENRTLARQKGRHARQDFLDNWTLEHMCERLRRRLQEASRRSDKRKRRARAGTSREAETERKTGNAAPAVVWHAPLFDASGYADEARQFVLGLDAAGLRVRAVPLHWGPNVASLDPQAFFTLQCLQGTQINPGTEPVISVFHTFPPQFRRTLVADYHIGRTMFETDGLPQGWVEACNQMDEIWVPSDFNVESFARAGVVREKLVKIPESIDVSQFHVDAPRLEIPGLRRFNFLSVFDWHLRKGWDVLLQAFLQNFGRDRDVALVLKVWSSYGLTLAQIRDRARAFLQKKGLAEDLPENVIFLDPHLTPQQLPSLYRTVDAFVLPSHGEGWGRPLMEAMLMGLPTIATRWSGQLEFMNEENSLLVDCDLVPVSEEAVAEVPTFTGQKWAQPSLEHLGERMRYVVENAEVARDLGARGREFVVQNFSRERVAKLVQRRIEEIGKRMKSSRRSILTVQTPPKLVEGRRRFAVVWEGSQFVYHSLALVNRELCSRLLAKGHEVSIVPYEPDQFSPGTDPRLQKLAARIGAQLSRPADVHVRHQWPPKLTPPEQGHWVVMQPWEFGSLPEEWVPVFSQQVDECWVPSTYVKEVYVASGVPAARVQVIPNGVDPARFHPDVKPFSLRTKKRFKFLYVGGTIYRKGIDLLLRAFTEVFSNSDEVCLVIKDLGGNSFYQGQTSRAKIQEYVKSKNAPEIEYIDAVLPEEEMAGLYAACDVLVHPYRGEGFGLPILEAMACGRAVIVTHGGAALDFCTPQNSLLVRAGRKRLPDRRVGQIRTVGIPWLYEVSLEDLKDKLLFAFRHPEKIRRIGSVGCDAAHGRWTWEHAAKRVEERLVRLAGTSPRRFLQEKGERKEEGGAPADRVSSLFQQGRSLVEAGDLVEGLRVLSEVLAVAPRHVATLRLMGELYQRLGRTREAEEMFALAGVSPATGPGM